MNEVMYVSETEHETQGCRFKISSKLKKRAPTFIADFEQSRVKVDSLHKLKFQSIISEADKDKKGFEARRSLLARSDHTNYTGSIPNDAHHFRNFVGVRDKMTGKIKLYDTVLFRMKPILKLPEIAVASEMPAKKTYWESMKDLTQSFGMKNKKRALNEHLKFRANLSINEENLNFNDLLLTEDNTSDRPVLLSGHQNLTYLPTINHEALTTDQVFDINEIITPQENLALKNEARLLLNADDTAMSDFRARSCKYVAMHLDDLNGDIEKAKYLIYFNYLVDFQHLKFNDLKKKHPAPNIPQPFKNQMLSNFTSECINENSGKASRGFPKEMKDKIVGSILVLALFIDDFLVNTNLVLNDLNQVALPKLTSIANALGCHIKSQQIDNETVKFIELKLPLFVLMPKYVKRQKSTKPF